MSPTPYKIEDFIGDEQLHGPSLYSIQRAVVLNNDLELLLPLAVKLLHHELNDNLLSVGFYNSVLHSEKVVLGVRVEALITHDWKTLEARLADVLNSEIVVMFIPITQNKTIRDGRDGRYDRFPQTPGIGVSIAPVGAGHTGTLGAYLSLRDPKGTDETKVFLTSSQVVQGAIGTAIQSPSRKDVETILENKQIGLNYITAVLKRAQNDEKFGRSKAGKEWLAMGPVRIDKLTKSIETIQAVLEDPKEAIIGNILHTSAVGSTGNKGSKMDWALIKYTLDTEIINERPDISRAPPFDPKIPRYDHKCKVWELKALNYNQWLCFRGRTSGVRSGYTNGIRTFANGSYELEALAADHPNPSEYRSPFFPLPPTPILYAGHLNPLAKAGDSGSTVWDRDGDLVGLLYAEDFGAVVTCIEEIGEDVKRKTGMELEAIWGELPEEFWTRYYCMILSFP
jgi:hypothetical protein